jgi:hypothetical protein
MAFSIYWDRPFPPNPSFQHAVPSHERCLHIRNGRRGQVPRPLCFCSPISSTYSWPSLVILYLGRRMESLSRRTWVALLGMASTIRQSGQVSRSLWSTLLILFHETRFHDQLPSIIYSLSQTSGPSLSSSARKASTSSPSQTASEHGSRKLSVNDLLSKGQYMRSANSTGRRGHSLDRRCFSLLVPSCSRSRRCQLEQYLNNMAGKEAHEKQRRSLAPALTFVPAI